MSEKLFKHRRIMPPKSLGKQHGSDTTTDHTVACDVFIINFVVDIVFTVIRQFIWAASQIVAQNKFTIPMDKLKFQLQLLSKYEHQIRMTYSGSDGSDLLEDLRELRRGSELFLEQLETKWYINTWLHEQEILEEFEAFHQAIEAIKCSIIEA